MSQKHLKSKFVRQFLCATHVSTIDFDELCESDVSLILDLLSHEILQKYPLKVSYLAKFLKQLINQMEKKENELCDEIYYKYIELIQQDINNGPFYKHYAFIINETNEVQSILTIKESTSFVCNGTTGLCTWQAGIAMAFWFIKNTEKIDGRFVLELGCGTGLSGLSACVNCKPREYWFTDCHLAVLESLKHNIEVNVTRNKIGCIIKTMQLSWDNINDGLFLENIPDVILAADVVYDVEMFDSLCQTLKWFLSNGTVEVYLFCTLRNHSTYRKFLETLKCFHLNFNQDTIANNYSDLLIQDCPINVINIKSNAT
ncbi:protein-lysine N-methyltransferase EEF2KMT [Daktulosphaira vitifoliae]|uniref:protein-lysine N-methyltransferase EEF2KMT n=1 Tax=Daktulosphaira vitifoliae TaxID=58002 RepID=UPI0021A9DA0D|nr:protein-lysine N-methyltransferase EEF2KMT [Daktulosphaira vitifoliae]